MSERKKYLSVKAFVRTFYRYLKTAFISYAFNVITIGGKCGAKIELLPEAGLIVML
jgi:hypothetical protein